MQKQTENCNIVSIASLSLYMHNNISIKLNSVEEFLYTLYSNTLGKVLYIVQSTLYESSIVVNVNDFQVNYFSLTIMYIY